MAQLVFATKSPKGVGGSGSESSRYALKEIPKKKPAFTVGFYLQNYSSNRPMTHAAQNIFLKPSGGIRTTPAWIFGGSSSPTRNLTDK